jgi:predicted ATP-grasp superfamily ATP-dependent carboligase
MGRYEIPVLVLGGGVTGLGVVWALGRRGIDVYLVVDRKNDYAIFSKYCKRSFIVPGYRQNREILNKLLRKISSIASTRIVVYPTSDLDALNLSIQKESLADDFYFVVGNKQAVEILVNKKKFYKLLSQSGINYPNTYFPENIEEIKQIADNVTYPIFMKPPITQLFTQIFGEGKGFIANSAKELIIYYKLAIKYGIKMMVQEIIPGPAYNSYQLEGYYNKAHWPVILFARQRLRIWPPDFGNTTLCISIPLAKLSKEKTMVNELLKKIAYSGLMSAEFKKDSRDGTLKFLEINARAWWHIWLSSICKADIIFSSYLDAIGEKVIINHEEYETGVGSTYLALDLIASAKMLFSRELSLKQWFASLQRIKTDAFFRLEDLSPFIMDFAHSTFSFYKYLDSRRIRSSYEDID